MATLRHKKPENWLEAVARNGHGLKSEELLIPADRATEALLMGLRLEEGIDLARIARMTAIARDDLVDQKAIARMAGLGLIAQTGDQLRMQPSGMLLLDAILPEIVSVSG
jgi:oxygen-independent coproporphyrinogen-3 oxidase